MATYIARGAAGLEGWMAQELESLGVEPGAAARGAVAFEAPEFPSPRGVALLRHLNHWARGVDRFGVLLADGEAADLQQIVERAHAVDYRPLIGAGQSFAVRARRRGEHGFGSLDVARRVGEVVIDALVGSGAPRPSVSLRDPDVIVRAELLDDTFLLWLDATGDVPLYQRDYRRQLHPASMRASMAHLLLRVGGWRGEPLLDPMTGIGTIPIEAGLYARAIAPACVRGARCAIDRMLGAGPKPGVSDIARAAGLVPPPALLEPDDELDVRGIERYERHLQGAWLNLAAAGSLPGVRLDLGDACRLERSIEAGRYRLAVLNPPFGRRVGSTGMVKDLYGRFARSAARCGIERVVTLAENRAVMSSALEAGGFEVTETIAVRYGDLPAHVVVAAKSARGA